MRVIAPHSRWRRQGRSAQPRSAGSVPYGSSSCGTLLRAGLPAQGTGYVTSASSSTPWSALPGTAFDPAAVSSLVGQRRRSALDNLNDRERTELACDRTACAGDLPGARTRPLGDVSRRVLAVLALLRRGSARSWSRSPSARCATGGSLADPRPPGCGPHSRLTQALRRSPTPSRT